MFCKNRPDQYAATYASAYKGCLQLSCIGRIGGSIERLGRRIWAVRRRVAKAQAIAGLR